MLTLVDGPATLASGVGALSEIGRPEPGDGREYVKVFGLVEDDVPALVKLSRCWLDDEHFEATSPSSAMWAPVHAWRALGELRAQVVIPTFLEMLDALDRRRDDWFLEEFPPLCERIGAPAADLLANYLLDAAHTEYARVAAAHGLQEIAAVDPAVRDRACEALAGALRPLSDAHPDLNAFLVSYLTDLAAVEHAGLIERAFEAGVVSELVCGDWPQSAFELGLGPAPPRRPSLLEQLGREMAEREMAEEEQPEVEEPRTGRRPMRSKVDKPARKRQRQARKKSRRR